MIKKCKQCGCNLTAAESNKICDKCRKKKKSYQLGGVSIPSEQAARLKK
ncbi:MAG: hypothetical protein RR131_09610 [Anaerovorax sp.]